MSLIRGFGGKCPCPICLVPDDKLSNLSLDYEHRTTEKMQSILDDANSMDHKKDGENLLKSVGLRGIDASIFPSSKIRIVTLNLLQNVFWHIENSDPFRALSFDRLHFNHGGLVSDHFWPEVQKRVSDIGRPAKKQVDSL